MQPPGSANHAVEREKRSVHNWRVSQLNRLGVPGILAEVYADRIDWHQIAPLIQQGCPPEVALRIVGKAHSPPSAATHAPGRSLVMTFRSARGDCMMSWTAQNRAASAVTAIRLVQKTAAGRRLRPPDLFGQRYWAV